MEVIKPSPTVGSVALTIDLRGTTKTKYAQCHAIIYSIILYEGSRRERYSRR